MISSTSRDFTEMEYTQQPKVLRPSWYTVPAIFSIIQSYTSAVEWFYYLTFISHILCKSDSAHIAKAHLISFLRARPHIQMWHEALLSEMYDEDELNLPSVLEGTDLMHPLIQRFHEYCTQRFSLMTKDDVFVARCILVDFIYRRLDDAQRAAELAKDVQTRKVLEEQGMVVKQREQARRDFEVSSLRFGSTVQDMPAVGQIGVRDLAGLLDALSLRSPLDLSVPSETVFATTIVPVQEVTLLTGLARSLTRLAVVVAPSYIHLAA
ncbi:hypothetical protein BKA58DRAFT_395782 [Alternaria rosae]|uniref:uncharacterized protein n=1 Tax=Alternaria rosae TaxID=1187941 RepID=UPI001E8DBBB5|nr:uncharacterized protein BKA58DRAFT_395782 [Alternaria rosae]KAH6881351.1 hypothetical protein BKA58DRAFT_395782 [Alternaria rosae]